MNTADFLSPKDYLAYLQNEVYGSSGRDLPIPSLSNPPNPLYQLLRELPGYDEFVFSRRAATRGEAADAGLLSQLERLVNKLYEINPYPRRDLRSLPVVYILTNSPNAMTVAVPGGGAVIVVDLSLEVLLTLLNLVLYMFDIQERDPDLREHPELVGLMPTREMLLGAVSDAIAAFTTGKPPDATYIPMLAGNSATAVMIAMQLTRGQTDFVLGHELAHVALGHIDDNRTYGLTIQGSKNQTVEIKAYRKMRSEELEADQMGLGILFSVAADEPSPLETMLLALGLEVFLL